MQGTVKWFDKQKGFGFIAGEDGTDYFIHYSELPEGTFLKEGEKVSFNPEQGPRGMIAKKLKFDNP